MKVFVAGATGVLGRRTVARLVASGVEVTGVSRGPEQTRALLADGVRPVEVSLFDRDALTAAVAGHQVVYHLATSIPTGARAADPAAWDINDRIRRDGSRNLVDAAISAGVERYVQESIVLLYADGGDSLLDETATVAPTNVTRSALTAEAEADRFAQQGGAGVVLRFGAFYGYDSAHSLETIESARHGTFALPGRADAYFPSVTTDDAAAAAVAALQAPGGVYNVAEDRPLTRAEHADALASALRIGALRLPAVPADIPDDASMMFRSLRVTSEMFKSLTGWVPRFADARAGWPFVVAALDDANRSEGTR